MMSFRLVPDQTNIPFLSFRKIAMAVSGLLALISVALLPTKGLNLGIDFQGGTMFEVRMPGDAADMGAMRSTLNGLGLGEVALQTFGSETDVLIRVERQDGEQDAQLAAVDQVKQALAASSAVRFLIAVSSSWDPRLADELFRAGGQAILFALIAILAYIWFRFEWQFAVGSIVALVHDVVLTLGVFSLLGLEFNLATVAALLTIVGYSLNDTVVVFDRVRENLRKYKKMLLPDLLDRSLNDTLARTLMTSVTTLLALAALYIFGGPVIRDFTFALIWGVLIGTYSSIFIASPILLIPQPSRRPGGSSVCGRKSGLVRSADGLGMELTQQAPLGGLQIVQSYGEGGFRVSGHRYQGSILILPGTTSSWSVGRIGDISLTKPSTDHRRRARDRDPDRRLRREPCPFAHYPS